MRLVPVPQAVTYRFGVKDSNYRLGFHPGTDYGSPVGTSALACEAGTATYLPSGSAGNADGTYGNQLKLTLDSGGTLYYCHLSGPLKTGRVVAGEPIARTGNTGFTTGPHLHIEYRPTDDLNKPADFEVWLKGGDDMSTVGEIEFNDLYRAFFGPIEVNPPTEADRKRWVGAETNTVIRAMEGEPRHAAYLSYIKDLQTAGTPAVNVVPYSGPALYVKK